MWELFNLCNYLVGLTPPPHPHHAHCSSGKNVTFSKTPLPGCRHANLVNIPSVTQCDSPHPFEKPSYALGLSNLVRDERQKYLA